MIARLLARLSCRNPSAAQPAERVSRPSTFDTGAGTGQNVERPRGDPSSSPVPAGAPADPVKSYADKLAAYRRAPYACGRHAELVEAQHARLRAELGR